jgi:hypothetical protein
MTSDLTGRGGGASGTDYEATTSPDGSLGTRDTYETASPTTSATTGATVATVPATTERTYDRVGDVGKDRVRWGPIVAGLLTAISSFILLSLLATAIGLQTVDSGNTNPQAAAQTSAIVAAVLGLIAFFLGGYVAGRTAAVRTKADGALNGFLMWALGLLTILVLAGLGLGQVFGAAGDQFGNYGRLGTTGADRNAIADALRNGALGAFLGMLLPAIAATVGGWLGAREQDNDTETVRSTNYRMEQA